MASYHHLPYITGETPAIGEVNVATSASIVFTIKTDDTSAPASSIVQSSLNVWLNDVIVIRNGVDASGGYYLLTFTPALRQLTVTINPVPLLAADTVYRVDATFQDDAGTLGSGTFAFSTGSAQFAMQLDRQEPLLCPIDNIPVPLMETDANVTTAKASDTITSLTTDWLARGLVAYDGVEVDGPDAGRWLIRSPSITTNRLYKTFGSTSTGLTAKGYHRQEFADRNPINLVLSPLFDYKLQKVWGDTALRYFGGYPSDAKFPVGFSDVPEATYHDANDRIAGAAQVTVGSTEVVGTGTTFTSLAPGSQLRFGSDPEVWTVQAITDNTHLTLPAAYTKAGDVSGTVAVVNGSTTVVGTGTTFTAQIRANQGIKFGSNATLYTVLAVVSDTQLTLTAAYGQASDPVIGVKVVVFPGLGIYTLDASNGGSFDDQTNRRLNFDIVNTPAPSSTKWDRYSIPLNKKIKPQITGTATVTNGSATVLMTSATFKDEMIVGAIVSFGTSTSTHQVTAIDSSLNQFTISPAWAGTTAATQAVTRHIAGTRILQAFRVTEMMERCEFFVGLGGSASSPTLDSHDRLGCSIVRRTDDLIELRAHLGTSVASKTTTLGLQDFVGKDWMLEIELISNNTVECRLFSFDDLTLVMSNRSVSIQNAALPAANPNLDRWTVTTLSTGLAQLNHRVRGWFSYVDVEPGQASPYNNGTAVITSSTAKARPARNIYSVPLEKPYGWKMLNVSTGVDAAAFTSTQFDRIFWDEDDVEIVIDSFDIDGEAVESLSNPIRQVPKFSFNQGFDQIHLTFRASRRGYWYVLVDSDNPQTGLVLAKGIYDVANSNQNVVIDGLQLGGLADGLHSIQIVICKEPVPSSVVYLPGVSFIQSAALLIKTGSTSISGEATVTATASVTPAEEEELTVIVDLSSQCDGVATTFLVGAAYRSGKIKVWLDGVLQNHNPIAGRVVETNHIVGTFTLGGGPTIPAPYLGQRLVVEYVPL